MAKLTDDEKQQVRDLANTSIEDMKSSLSCMPDHYSVDVLNAILKIARRRKEKTRIRICESMIKRLQKGDA